MHDRSASRPQAGRGPQPYAGYNNPDPSQIPAKRTASVLIKLIRRRIRHPGPLGTPGTTEFDRDGYCPADSYLDTLVV